MQVDAVVIGGGIAGLQAALTLGRSCRKVALIDAGAPRNRFAPHSHNLITRDGVTPDELVRLGRADLAPYDVTVLDDRVADLVPEAQGFRLTLASGPSISARGVVLATGVRDLLPAIPGFAAHWGRSIFFCPFCHGWEFRGKVFAVYGSDRYASHMVRVIHGWTDRIVLLTDGPPAFDDTVRQEILALGIPIHEAKLTALEGDETLVAAHLADGSRVPIDALMMHPPTEPASDLAQRLGVLLGDDGMPVLSMMKESSVPGLFIAGDAAQQPPALPSAIMSGALAGGGLQMWLVQQDLAGRAAG